MADRRDIEHVDLRLDQKNPRHDPVKTQREAIAALLADSTDREKIITLARHMGKYGPSPVDSILVVEENGHNVVIEGNRRTAALKLLHNPDLAQEPSLAKRFRQIAAGADELPRYLSAVTLPSRDDAREWQMLRHGGEQKGAGVVNWGAEATQRLQRTPGTHSARALLVLDAIGAAYSDDQGLLDTIDRVKRTKLTTFGRLVSDPHVRDSTGIGLAEGDLSRHYPVDILKPAFTKILTDLDATLSVSALKTKEQRREYVESIHSKLPDAKNYSASSEPFESKPTPRKKKKSTKAKPPPKLFDGLSLVKAPDRIQDLITETRKLDPKSYPNATALLMRAVVELLVGEAIQAQSWPTHRFLKDRIAECLKRIDPSDKDARYQAVRAGLADTNHVMSATTLNAWVHNVHFNPPSTDLHTIAKNWTPFVQALDAFV